MDTFSRNETPSLLDEAQSITDAQEIINVDTLDYSKVYDNCAYESYINNFERCNKKKLFYRFIKRSFDIFSSLFALILLSPVFLIVAILIKLESKGPIIFKQTRVGKNGKPFSCYKFRSMKITAPKNCPTNELGDNKDYVTRVGRFLRKVSIDELPQLWCCLIGTMSVIGYRPLIPNEQECNDMRERLGVFVMRPGITGYAQVVGRDDVYYKNKAILDAEYVKRASLWCDIKILFRTVAVVISRRGAK